jgi:hypothetical protein
MGACQQSHVQGNTCSLSARSSPPCQVQTKPLIQPFSLPRLCFPLCLPFADSFISLAPFWNGPFQSCLRLLQPCSVTALYLHSFMAPTWSHGHDVRHLQSGTPSLACGMPTKEQGVFKWEVGGIWVVWATSFGPKDCKRAADTGLEGAMASYLLLTCFSFWWANFWDLS